MHNVLIVDEEEHLLSALEQNLFPDRDDISILTASDGERGLEHLKNSRIDLLISDIKMPGTIDGFQLILRAKEVAPDARVVIITAFGSNRVQNFADRIGITHYIEKPFNTSELREVILEILDEKEGFQGVLSDLELTDIIQMLCLARRTALLHLKHRDHRGRIVFDNGDVVHAEFDDLVGSDAVYRMLALRQGDIFMQGDFRNDQRTIDIGWQDLLFEGVKRADEERADLDDDEDEDEDAAASDSTDTGMGISSAEIDAIVEDAMEDGVDSSFFSDDELREIEAATGVGEDDSDAPLPFATLQDAAEPVDDDDFRSPFQRESSGLSGGLTSTGVALAPPDSESEAEPEPEPEEVVELDPDHVPFDQMRAQLDKFARDCPGLSHTAIVSDDEGLAICEVSVGAEFEPESFAALSHEIIATAQRAIEALGPDLVGEVHVAAGDHYVLLRPIVAIPYHHVAVVDRTVSLGVALVLMRRLGDGVRADLESQ